MSTSKKYKKRSQEYYRHFPKEEKINERTCANIRNKNMSDVVRERKKKYLKKLLMFSINNC